MFDLTRRQVLHLGATGAGAALLPWLAHPRPASAAPAAVLAANDLALWYDESAGTDWLRALPVGNGRLGAMVFGNVDVERLQLNEDTVWAGGPYDSSNAQGAQRCRRSGAWSSPTSGARRRRWSTRPCAAGRRASSHTRRSAISGSPSQAARSLRVLPAPGPHHGDSSVSYLQNGVRFQREVLASAPDQVIAVRLTADRAGSITFSARFDSPQRTTLSSPDGATVAIDGVSGDMEGVTGRVRFLSLARAVATGGSVSSSGGTLAGPQRRQRDAADLHRHQLRHLRQRERRLPGHRTPPPRRRTGPVLGPAAKPACGRLPGAVRPDHAGPRPHGRGGPADRRPDLASTRPRTIRSSPHCCSSSAAIC